MMHTKLDLQYATHRDKEFINVNPLSPSTLHRFLLISHKAYFEPQRFCSLEPTQYTLYSTNDHYSLDQLPKFFAGYNETIYTMLTSKFLNLC